MNISRRKFLKLSSVLASTFALPACTLNAVTRTENGYVYDLSAEPATAELVAGYETDVLGFNGQIPAPTIRCRQGEKVTIRFTNKLNEPTTIHWHGLRIPIEMDGVPFLSQPPIMPGETFTYEFIPPDAGTFWYHPHMNSVVQLGMGLVGAIVVEEATPVTFDAEQVLLLKHWHIDKKGNWKKLMVPRLSARMGTPGEWGSVNGEHLPTYELPQCAMTRLRIANVDNTITYPIAVEGAQAWIIAIDGNPIEKPRKLVEHKIGPGMRVDLAVEAPSAGKQFQVQQMKGKIAFPLASFRSVPSSLPSGSPVPQLPLNPVPALDLERAETLNFVFEWEGAISPADPSGKAMPKFWLNEQTCMGRHEQREYSGSACNARAG